MPFFLIIFSKDLGLYFRGRPLMKRLRIRGDWSDTGPNARPEAEARGKHKASFLN